jgi:ZIP family zinc transporter
VAGPSPARANGRTMIPNAFEHGGRPTGVVTTLGFALAFAISALE